MQCRVDLRDYLKTLFNEYSILCNIILIDILIRCFIIFSI